MKKDINNKKDPERSFLSRLRYLKILLLLAIFVSALVLAALPAFLNSDHARTLLLAEINKDIAGRLDIRAHRISLLGGHLEIRDARLETPSNRPVAGFQKLAAELRWASLLRGNLEFISILVDHPWTDTVSGRDGRVDLMAAVETEPKTSEDPSEAKERADKTRAVFGLLIHELSIRNGRVVVENPEENVHFHLDGIDAQGRVDLSGESADLKLEVSSGAYRSSGIDTAMGPLTLDARRRGRRVDIAALVVETPAGTFSGAGTVQIDESAPQVDIETRWHVSLDKFAEAFGNGKGLAGIADIKGSIRGPLDNPVVMVSAMVNTPAVGPVQFHYATLQATLNDRVLELQGEGDDGDEGRFMLSGMLDVRKAFPDGLFSTGDVRQAFYRLDVRQQNLHLGSILPSDHSAKGVINGRQEIAGTGLGSSFLKMNLTAEASAVGLLISPGVTPIQVRIESSAAVDEGTLRVSRLKAVSGDTALQLDGSLRLENRDADFRFELQSPDIAGSLRPLGIDGIAGALNASGKITGPLSAPVFSVRGSADHFRLQDIPVGDVRFAAGMDTEGVLQVSELWIRDHTGEVRIQGTAHFPEGRLQLDPKIRVDATADLTNLDLDRFYDVLPLGGRYNGEIRLTGPLASATGTAMLSGEDVSWGSYRIGRLQSQLRWSSGRLLLDRIQLVNGDAEVLASGELQALESGSLNPIARPEVRLALTGDIPDMHVFQSDLGGRMTLRADLQGTFPDLRGNIFASASNIRHPWQDIEQVDIDAIFEGETFRIRQFAVLFAPGETLHASGRYGLDGTYDGEITSTEISLDRFRRLQEQTPVSGHLKIALSGAGRIDAPNLEGSITIGDAAVRGEPLGDVRLDARLADRVMKINGRLGFDMDAMVDLMTRNAQIRLMLADTEMAPYLRIAGYPDLSGKTTGQLTAAGNLNAPFEKMSVKADISRVSVHHGDRRVVTDGRMRAELDNGILQIDETELVFDGGGRLQVWGSGGKTVPLDLAVEGRFPGAVLQWIDPSAPPVEGNLDIAGHVKGTWDSPEADIAVDLHDISMPVPGFSARLHELNGRIHFTEKKVIVGPLNARIGDGTCRLQGMMPLDRFRPTGFDFALNAESLPIRKPGTLAMTLDGDLTLRGTPAHSRIEGTIQVLEGAYTRDVRLDLMESVTVRRRPAAKAPAAPVSPLLEGMTLQVAVRSRQPFRIVNNLARLQLEPDLQIVGTAAAPVLVGRAEVLSGSIEYRKRGFRITRGIIDFTDPYKTQPVLDVTGETRVRNWDIFLQLTGPPEAIAFKFRSEPMEAEEDIVSLLLFGKTTREMINAEGGVSVSPSSLLADLIVSKYGKDLRGITGIDTMEVAAGEDGHASDVKVTVGKNLSERLSLKYTTDSGSQGVVQQAAAEYKLLETLLVTGFQNNRGVFGGNLVFRLEFQ